MNTSKRKLDHSKGPQSKKKKVEEEDEYHGKSWFCEVCKRCGLVLKNGSKYNKMKQSQAIFQKNLLKEIRTKASENGVEKFVEGFQEYIEEPKRFHKSLLPCVTSPDCDGARGGFQGSIVKILLGIDSIQSELMTVLIEKLPEFMGDEDSSILEQGQKVNLPHLLLSQFQWLDNIVNSKELSSKLLEMITVSNQDVQREIIMCIPYVIQDAEHSTVAESLREILNENKQLTVPILDTMSNLRLTPQLLVEVRETVLQSLAAVELDDLPVSVKFLLQSVTAQDALEVVSELRANLEFDSSTMKSSKGSKNGEKQDTESLILDVIKSSVRFQKQVGDALIKSLETVKLPDDHKVIDLFILLILHGTPRKKVVESVFRNKIRSGCFTSAYLKDIFKHRAQLLKAYFPSLLSLTEILLRSPELPVSYFGSSMYKYSFAAFEPYHQQEIVGNLLAHVGSGIEGEVDIALEILTDLVNQYLTKMAPFAILVKNVLDYLDNLSVCQIRKLYFMLSVLAFKNPQEGGLIQDDLHMVIRKQLSNDNPKYRRMGVLGAIMVVSCTGKNMTEDSQDSEVELNDNQYKQTTNLLQQVQSSSSKSPEAYSLFMDELSSLVAKGQLHSKVENWISENLTADFTDAFVVDFGEDGPKEAGNIPIQLLYGLDDESEGIAINLLPLVVKNTSNRNAMNTLSENCISNPVCLAPSVRLLRVCEERISGNLENIDALLGCPLYITKEEVYEKLEPLSQKEKELIVASLFYCINWFIEMVNGFSGQNDPEIKGKVITRLQNITELQKILQTCLALTPGYRPPLANFDLEDGTAPSVPTAASTSGAAKGGKKKKGKKQKKGEDADQITSDNDDNSRDNSQLNNTTMNNTQAPTQNPEPSDTNGKPSINLASYKPFFRELHVNNNTQAPTQNPETSDADGKPSINLASYKPFFRELHINNNTQAPTQNPETSDANGKPSINLASYKPFFRELDVNVFAILNAGPITKTALDSEMHTKDQEELSLQPPQVLFLMEDLCRKLGHSLLSSSSKRKTFFKVKGEKKVGFSNLDLLTPLQVAKNVIKLLPALCNHLEGVSGFFQTLISENDGVLDGPGSKSPEALIVAQCFQLLLEAILAIFSWNGFQATENADLLKEGLGVVAKRMKSTSASQMSLKDLVKSCMQYFGNYASTAPNIYTVVPLLKLMITLTEKIEDKQLTRKIAPLAEEFLKREWLNTEGEREKGAKFNEQLQIVIKTYIVYSEDPLLAVEALATKGTTELLEADKNGCSATYPTMSRASYPVFYRVLFSELIEAVKSFPPPKQTEHLDLWMERLIRWNIAVRILNVLVNLIKVMDSRSNLGTCMKYGRFFVDLFLRVGMPMLDKMFRNHRADIQSLLKNLQLSTRALHHMCGHSKSLKDVTLTNLVPMLKRSLEVFVFRVKVMLNVNKCLEAFWMGNLKNRDLQGNEILSQTTQGGDSDGENLPDDADDDLSDVELDNESVASNETEGNITDPEGASFSQSYN